jgi:hypothetical protein
MERAAREIARHAIAPQLRRTLVPGLAMEFACYLASAERGPRCGGHRGLLDHDDAVSRLRTRNDRNR